MAGASPSTVSFVLNGKDKEMRISPLLAEHIRTIASGANYEPNRVAVSLRTGRSNIIGLIVDNISGSFFASLAQHIESELERYGYKVIYCSTGNDKKKSKDLIRMLNLYQVDGFLITPSEGIEKELETLLKQQKPLVLIDSFFPGMQASYVLVDNYDGVSNGMMHLIGKGYQNIAIVINDVNLIQMQERKRAYMETLAKEGMAVQSRLLLQTSYNTSKEDITAAIAGFLQQQKPDAVFFSANYLGVCGLNAIRQLGLKIPDDIAVICFDDHELFSLHQPGITAVQQPIKEIADTAVEILLSKMDILNQDQNLRQVQIKATLVQRLSV